MSNMGRAGQGRAGQGHMARKQHEQDVKAGKVWHLQAGLVTVSTCSPIAGTTGRESCLSLQYTVCSNNALLLDNVLCFSKLGCMSSMQATINPCCAAYHSIGACAGSQYCARSASSLPMQSIELRPAALPNKAYGRAFQPRSPVDHAPPAAIQFKALPITPISPPLTPPHQPSHHQAHIRAPASQPHPPWTPPHQPSPTRLPSSLVLPFGFLCFWPCPCVLGASSLMPRGT